MILRFQGLNCICLYHIFNLYYSSIFFKKENSNRHVSFPYISLEVDICLVKKIFFFLLWMLFGTSEYFWGFVKLNCSFLFQNNCSSLFFPVLWAFFVNCETLTYTTLYGLFLFDDLKFWFCRWTQWWIWKEVIFWLRKLIEENLLVCWKKCCWLMQI